MLHLLLITNSEEQKIFIKRIFKYEYNIEVCSDLNRFLEIVKGEIEYDLFFVDLSLLNLEIDEKNSISLVDKIFSKLYLLNLSKKIILLTTDQNGNLKRFRENSLPFTVLNCPFEIEDFKRLSLIGEPEHSGKNKASAYVPEYHLTTKSPRMLAIYEELELVAGTDASILFSGESGTGKSLLALTTHELSSRRKERFVNVNCGAISENLFESEFFGHEKGSFTGAIKTKLGKFEIANNGTIFLDEVGTISLSSQVSLLHVLQNRTFQRVGGEKEINVNVRVIAATNLDLEAALYDGKFRADLYYRLNVFPIKVPSLKERREDIIDIAFSILARLGKVYKKTIDLIHPDVESFLLSYSWPGNVRELENMIERAYILEKSSILQKESFFKFAREEEVVRGKLYPSLNLGVARRFVLNDFEQNYINQLLKETEGDLKLASIVSGVSVRQLRNFIAKHNVDRRLYFKPEIPSEIQLQ